MNDTCITLLYYAVGLICCTTFILVCYKHSFKKYNLFDKSTITFEYYVMV